MNLLRRIRRHTHFSSNPICSLYQLTLCNHYGFFAGSAQLRASTAPTALKASRIKAERAHESCLPESAGLSGPSETASGRISFRDLTLSIHNHPQSWMILHVIDIRGMEV